MTKENLFDNITLDEAKVRLQAVSERMDEVIEERRKIFRSKFLGRWEAEYQKAIREDPFWNMAHDVLEVIHCSEPTLAGVIEEMIDDKISLRAERLETRKPAGEIHIKVNVDTSQLDQAITKIEKYSKMIDDNLTNKPFLGLGSLTKAGEIFTLVVKYGWDYADAVNFAERYHSGR